MTVKELFLIWLMESKNKQYLSDLSSCDTVNTDTNSDDNTTNPPKKRKVSANHLQIKPFYLTKRSAKSITKEIKNITIKFKNILSKYETAQTKTTENGLNKQQFEAVTVTICGFSRYCNSLLFNKILLTNTNKENQENQENQENIITLSMFINFWSTYFSENDCLAYRFIKILKTDIDAQNNNYLNRSDFIPLIRDILFSHPGLEFLRESLEFHDFYISTVICRIFYYLDTQKINHICVGQLRRSNFLDILLLLDEELDINEIFDYFSYEHFYVIYTKFWELDEKRDNLLRKTDLIKYGDYALIPKVIDRIIIGSQNKLKTTKKKTTINYEEFVDFIISEEDKTSITAMNYWFRILDLDDDGILSPYELEIFFQQQSAKILNFCGETLQFQNILILLNDMIGPKINFKFTMNDIKKSKMAPVFFDTLININKFALNEQKDIESINRIRNSPHMSDWDRFASKQYFILSNS